MNVNRRSLRARILIWPLVFCAGALLGAPAFGEDLCGTAEPTLGGIMLGFSDDAKVILQSENIRPVTQSTFLYTGKRDKNGKKIFRKAEKITGKEVALVTMTSQFELRVVRFEVLFASDSRKEQSIGNVSPSECRVERLGGGGVNTDFSVDCGFGKEPVLAGLQPLLDYRRFKYWDKKAINATEPVIYTPYSDDLMLPVVVCRGEEYLVLQIARARESLIRDKVKSRAFGDALITDIFDKKIVFYLALIEHIDEKEFEEKGPFSTSNKVLVQFAMNREDTFRYATSRTGALCLMQIMSGTYAGIRKQYPEARLPQNAREGSCASHEGAIRVAYLVLDEKLAAMPEEFKQNFLKDPERYGIYLAAAYNGGGMRAKNLYAKLKPDHLAEVLASEEFFKSVRYYHGTFRILKRETWIFIRKYRDIKSFFSRQEELEK